MSSPYSDLQPIRKEIRLLELDSSTDFDSPITCTSRVVSLFEQPSYTALSYCWGERTDTIEITFNGVTDFRIPRNLRDLLRRLRQESKTKAIWADAICINQDSDASEKNQQVGMMREIYAQARSTIIWLGEAADDSDLAMDIIADLHEHDIWDIGKHIVAPAQYDAIAALNSRPWWSRVWVIQELLLSAQPLVWCGSKVVLIEAFIHLDDLRRGYHRPSGETIDNAAQTSRYLLRQNSFSQILHHYFNDKQRVMAGVVPLEEWLVVVNDFHATDPRDKVYGLLGLGKEQDRQALPPDYSLNNVVADVYCRATARFILERCDLLHLQFNVIDVDPILGLPSWCPDYSCDPSGTKERYTAFVVGIHDNAKLSAATARTSSSIEALFPKADQGDWRELHLRGWEVDRVVYAGVNPYLVPYTGSDATARLANIRQRGEQTKANAMVWEVEARGQLTDSHPYAPRTVDDVFWRSLMADRDFTWHPVPDSWKQYYDIWLDRAPLPAEAASLADDDAERRRLYVKPYTDAAITRPHGRAFIITSKGHLGLAPRKTMAGDVVSVLKGGNVPFILRRREQSVDFADNQGTWQFIGESSIMGLMEGQGAGVGFEKEFVIL